MSTWIDVDVPGGYRAAGLSDWAGPWLVIHVDALELSDEELGKVARACGDAAYLALACTYADWIVCNGRGKRPWDIRDDMLQHYSLMVEYCDRYPIIADALAILEQARTYQLHKATKPQKRREVQNNYDRLFIQIGRRDGFRCKRCGADRDLNIDHIVALAFGGTNDMDNLQLLCGPCNSSKGAS